MPMNIKNTLSSTAFVILACLALLNSPAAAHHGISGQFDLGQNVTVTGTVSRVRFVNPHAYVYFKVTNAAGEEEQWRCELRSASLLKRAGWSEEMFDIGSKITVSGSPDRRDPQTCFAQRITFENGRVVARRDTLDEAGQIVPGERSLKLEDGSPNLSGNSYEARGGIRGGGRPNTGRPRGGGSHGGPGGARPLRPPRYEMTEFGREESGKYSESVNPRLMCEPTNIVVDYNFDQMVNKIEQYHDKIIINYGFMDVVRTIHLGSDFPKTIESSLTGHSIGEWKGDTLIVTTKGFVPGFLRPPGGGGPAGAIRHGDQMIITEKFSVNEEGTELTREYTVEDPIYLVQPLTHFNKSQLTSSPFIRYDCEDLTEDKYGPGAEN